MVETLKPATDAQLRDVVRWAAAEEVPLEVRGGGSRAGFGRPVQAGHVLVTSELRGILSYEPEELVLTAAAATPMAEIEQALQSRSQMLAFEPVDSSAVFGAPPGSGTIAGALGVALSGPRRIKAGGARDHLLGFQAVSGRGEIYKGGGKVVKNVTGYDLPKIICGAFGTLSVLTEVTVKVLPAPPKTRTVLLFGLGDAAAAQVMADALNSPCEVSGAAHLPAAIAGRSGVDLVRDAGESVTALRVEGTPGSVAARCESLRRLLAGRGRDEELHSMRSLRLWREIRDVAALLPDPQACLWRLSMPPAAAAAAVAGLGGARYFDWGGGLVWLAMPATGDGGTETIRHAVGKAGGHATLVRGSEAMRAAVPVFEPQPSALAAVTRRVKEGFDPRRILNPGRMYAGV
ncbi:MAG: glycolate oxidase subunit GlcE [Alphaproteobacteria bacterium]|nr:glycolate oxidase subunit GlcE [Alphaproteobacteria bacterium]